MSITNRVTAENRKEVTENFADETRRKHSRPLIVAFRLFNDVGKVYHCQS